MVRAAPGRGWRRVKDRPGFARRGLERLPDGSPLRSPERLGRDLGLGAVSSLGLNEGVEGPFPAALAALERLLPTLNRYPGRGSLELSEALAERLGVDPAQLFVCAGADAAIGYVCQAVLEPGDEAVTAWPSFPSFVSDTLRRDAVPVRVALRDDWSIDLDALQAAVTDRTRLVFVATPNNPTGLALGRDEVTEFVDALPAHVVTVLDEAYFDYLDPATRLDGVAHLVRRGKSVLALRTFSKLYGLAGLRIGYAVGPAALVDGLRRVQRGYDVSSLGQEAALASLDDDAEVAVRRTATAARVAALEALLRDHGAPVTGSVANFVLLDVGPEADALAERLLRGGVVVQKGTPFGAPNALRITSGSPTDLARLAAALRA